MPTITEARQALAAAAGTVAVPAGLPGFTVKALPPVNGGRAGDIFTVVGPTRVASFRTALAEIQTVVILGPEGPRAEELADELTVPMLDAITSVTDFPVGDVEVERISLILGEANAAPLYALTITAKTEVG